MKKRVPKFQEGMRLMRHSDPQLQEDGFHLLLPYAHEYTQQLIDSFRQEADSGLRHWLLELLSAAKDPEALPIFLEYLHSDESGLKSEAIRGLKILNTKEARRALWEAEA
ncbi:hypothetical protein KDH_66650 [Dictyobacter sp. S3.2.2.5]|uniref:HEAT repeat domain-containing protein n=1 Tax=Dictyobacter halimunensis TaxID=3026934 RepID=A0ABQ6G008_9CHLR|nr:hypothetical protein KDH_66650 [Dictyobacter sp. S3.2.2.5]